MRTYGKLWLEDGNWHLQCEPHVSIWAKRIFQGINKGQQGILTLRHTPAVARDLEWFLQRFTLEVMNVDVLRSSSVSHQESLLTLDRILQADYTPRPTTLALPLRDYQARAAEMAISARSLLLADDVGLGKTVSAIGILQDPRTLPAVVVTLAHLPHQWEKEIHRFAPSLLTHVIDKATPYVLPRLLDHMPDVLLINYHKLAGWAEVLAAYAKSVIFDEVQELRRGGTHKSNAARHIAAAADFRLGLSATPIYNYGGEIYHILRVVCPDALSDQAEFFREWCEGWDRDKARLKDPVAFGSWLREQHLMLRRTRAEVGRELPPLQRIVQEVESDEHAFAGIDDSAAELARIILGRAGGLDRGEQMRAAGEFDSLMRQATGVAKAPHVAAWVKLLVENGERVVLFGWHRAVYEIWLQKLADYKPALFTGSETAKQKEEARRRFIDNETPILIMSLRAGAGLDGLQRACRTVVIGELDWSPGVIEQCIGRVFRDGQPEPVTAYFMLAGDGADPIMAETLGLKREQIEGLRDSKPADLERLERNADGLKDLARAYLKKRGGV